MTCCFRGVIAGAAMGLPKVAVSGPAEKVILENGLALAGAEEKAVSAPPALPRRRWFEVHAGAASTRAGVLRFVHALLVKTGRISMPEAGQCPSGGRKLRLIAAHGVIDG